jgi:formate hydrogenlyase transcriptional activator
MGHGAKSAQSVCFAGCRCVIVGKAWRLRPCEDRELKFMITVLAPNDNSSRRLEALLDLSRTIAAHQDFGAWLGALSICLREVVDYDYVVLLLYDEHTEEAWIYYPGICEGRLSKVDGFPFIDGPGFWVWKYQRPAVKNLDDFERDYPKVFPKRRRQNMRSSCTVPLTAMHRRLGAMEFLTSRENAYSAEDVRFLQLVAAQIASAVENALSFDRIRSSEDNLARQRDHLRSLLEITNTAVSKLDTSELLDEISAHVKRLFAADFCGLLLHDATNNLLRWETFRFRDGGNVVKPERLTPLSGAIVTSTFRNGRPRTLAGADIDGLGDEHELITLLRHRGLRSLCALPLISRGTTFGVLLVGQFNRDAFYEEEVRLLEEIAGQVSMSVANTLAYREVRALRDKLNFENLYLEAEIKEQYNFDEIVGDSKQLRVVLEQVQMIAGNDSSVLILGETGTGKELIARAIHNLSARRDHGLVRMNCAAIPAELLESDLFGHERGAFTGAIAQKIGRFELAHNGTIFLDEVGDIPLELQPKLLRVLQEREIERLGSARPIRLDVRIIAATNRDLRQMIADRRFRSDLFYRLNVFPIVIPPLRERPEDIPLLVRHFVQKYARKLKREIDTISVDTMAMLTRLPWPGNVRELEHVIERAVILSRGPVLQVPIDALGHSATPHVPSAPARTPGPPRKKGTLEDIERAHILDVLHDTNGMVGGPRGAAARLGLKRTTLLSKMKRLGIPASRGAPHDAARRHWSADR